jgi:molybdenum cofactor cytidylyltransferase
MIAAVVLAAGLSRRMGRPKLLLDLGGKPVVRWAVERVLPHVGDIVVVTPPDDAAIRTALSGLDVRFVVNPRPEAGQGASIAAGIAALLPTTRAAFIVLGDQPHVPDGVFRAMIDAFEASERPIAAPVYRGVRGNPVLFAARTFTELAAVAGDAGARAVVLRDPGRVALVPVDEDMPADVDTPADYARLADAGPEVEPPCAPPSRGSP